MPTRAPVETDRYLVVSIDSHCGPEPRQLRLYCEQKHLADFDEWAASLRSEHEQLEELLNVPHDLAAETTGVELPRDRGRYTSGNLDINERLRHMDEDGVAAEVIFHGGQNGQLIPFSDFTLLTEARSLDVSRDALALRAVGYSIYNRWLADWISVQPERHVGVAHIPFWDIEAAVREVEAARGAGLTSVNFPAPREQLPPYNDAHWEPLWDVCEALEVPLSSHGGNATGDYRGVESVVLMLMEVPFFGRRALWYMIFGGVFERHPGLKLVITEQRWDNDVLIDMDSAYLANPTDPDFPTAHVWSRLRELLPRLPSEYFATNCFIGASMLSHLEAQATINAGLTGNVMWGSDYPHMEGCWPHTRLSMRKTFAGLPHDVNRLLLGENAVKVYNLDKSKLRKVVDRVGPTIEELDEPYEGQPSGNTGWAFRERGKWS
jgi:predicted TIM-barrel fold metal-dependent hydrolase